MAYAATRRCRTRSQVACATDPELAGDFQYEPSVVTGDAIQRGSEHSAKRLEGRRLLAQLRHRVQSRAEAPRSARRLHKGSAHFSLPRRKRANANNCIPTLTPRAEANDSHGP